MHSQEEFLRLSETGATNLARRGRTEQASASQVRAIDQAAEQFANLELARDRAAYYKWKVLESLDKYLIEFEANLIRRGGKVIWAIDAEAAREELQALIRKNNSAELLYCGNMLKDELGLTEGFRQRHVSVTEGFAGEYIRNQLGESSYHTVNPVMHLSVDDIRRRLNDKIGVSLEAEPGEILDDIRKEVKPKWQGLNMAVLEGQFLIAENGMVAFSDDEGSVPLSLAFAKSVVILAGIDSVIPTLNDLDIYYPLYATFSRGEQLNAYHSIAGPRQPGETDGPAEFVVILVDNGRSNLLAQPDQRQSLSCINCGACSHVCPVFNIMGGNTFENGPIGAVKTPHAQGLNEYKHLSFASTLCGKCTAVCPVKIDLHNHLLRNRRDSVNQGYMKRGDRLMWLAWKKMMLNRKNLNRNAGFKNFTLKSFLKSDWGEQREFPKIAEKSFNQLWREKHGA